ncbi:MAG: hypothetical protein AB1716_23595 [Planctomycetota bacterium]
MLNLSSLLGTCMLAALVFLVMKAAKPAAAAPSPAEPAAEVASDVPACAAEEWCDAFEAVFGAPVFVLDGSMRLSSCGCAGKALLGLDGAGRARSSNRCHLIDVVPGEAAMMLLGAVSRAKRGERAQVLIPWGDAHRDVICVSMPGPFVVVGVRVSERKETS